MNNLIVNDIKFSIEHWLLSSPLPKESLDTQFGKIKTRTTKPKVMRPVAWLPCFLQFVHANK